MAQKTEKPLDGMKILLAEDEETIAVPLADEIEAAGGEIQVARDGLAAARELEETAYDVLVTDVRMPGMEGTDLLAAVAEKYPAISVIMITGYGTVESAVEAMRMGAYDYILKPFYNEDIILKLVKLKELGSLKRENQRLREELGEVEGLDRIVGKSDPMVQTCFSQCSKRTHRDEVLGGKHRSRVLPASQRTSHDIGCIVDAPYISVHPIRTHREPGFGHRV